jgi:8-oxo-dGTP diphosphatase
MLLLRHASAGERLSSPSLDRARGLDDVGRAQAKRLAELLSARSVERLVSSPLARCVETVEELATALGLLVELRDELLPSATKLEILALLDELPEGTVICTHRELFETLFGGGVTCEKGGAWTIDWEDGTWRASLYLPPPTVVAEARRRTAAARSAAR